MIEQSSIDVSVIIPVYNGVDKGLEKCIKSIISQSVKNIEVVVIDDHSKDDSLNLIKKLLSNFEKAKIIENDINLGLSKTWNKGILNSNGRYILLMHQDCILSDENQIENAYLYLKEHPEIDGIIGTRIYHDFNKLNFFQKFFEFRINHFLENLYLDDSIVFTENKVDIYKKELLIEIGLFNEELRNAGEDHIFSYKIREKNAKIIKGNILKYYDDLGDVSTFKQVLKKEWLYGTTLPFVFLNVYNYKKNNLKIKKKSILQNKIINRFFSYFWIIGFLLSLIFYILNYNLVLVLIPFILSLLIRALHIIILHFKIVKNLNDLKLNLIANLFMTYLFDFIYSMAGFYAIFMYLFKNRHN
ncbi:MAG: glycosyltransferase family 2 protein [Minisyncoccia bacterium]|jgi:glycosyltransferase involved in cell wall biosynthesis